MLPCRWHWGVLGNSTLVYTDNISSYIERMQLYFDANAVKDDRKVAVLLTVIGAKIYETLRNLLAPQLPRDKSFTELLEVLKKHYDPQPLIIGERFRFYQRSQKSGESTLQFLPLPYASSASSVRLAIFSIKLYVIVSFVA